MLSKFLDKYKQLEKPIRIAVIGDLIIDEFFECKANRLSPEAPVPVLLTNTQIPTDVKLGGAGLVATQLANFCDCTLFCFKDQYEIRPNFNIIVESVKQIPIKRRFYDGSMTFPRWDIEHASYGEKDLISKRKLLFEKFQFANELNKFDAAILTDYSKGTFSLAFAQQIIGYCNDLNIPTVIDPKHNLNYWMNCTIFKPNSHEIAALTDSSDKNTQVQIVKEKINCKYVIVTDKNNGVFGDANIDGKNEIIGKSVSGAGDAYSGFLAVALSIGFSIQESAEIAFDAGYCYVMGNDKNSVLDEYKLRKYIDPIQSKIITVDEFVKIRPNGKIVMVNGCFDAGLTVAHTKCLQYAKSRGDYLIVALNSDDSVQQLKGKGRPILPLEDRMAIIASLDVVDFVVSFEELNPLNLIKALKIDVVIKGGDYRPEDVVGYGIVDVEIAPLYKSISTTQKISYANQSVDSSI